MKNPVFLMVFEITSKSGQNKVKLAAKHFKTMVLSPFSVETAPKSMVKW